MLHLRRMITVALLLASCVSAAHALPLGRSPDRVDGPVEKWSQETPTAAKAAPAPAVNAATPCSGGMAGVYPCNNISLLAYVPLAAMGTATAANDIWGWTDSLTGNEYALVGLTNGTAFVDITDPTNPVYLGRLPTHTSNSDWRDLETYANHAFIVSEASAHGMQVFDLRQLRAVVNPPVTFVETKHYAGFGNAHTIAVNEATGFAYAMGTGTCSGGLHMVNIQDPMNPTNAGCFSSDGYTHDGQCVVYNGPDADYQGREVCFCCNENTITIVDVTNKAMPVQLSRTTYTGVGYTHQGWLTEDQRYFLLDDEFDELNTSQNTKTYMWNMANLDAPAVIGAHFGPTAAIDHNQYVRGNFVYQANYRAGLRVLNHTAIAGGMLTEVGYFDIYPGSNTAQFNGAWSAYPFFPSGVVVVSGIEQGLFVLDVSSATGTASIAGTATLEGETNHSGVLVVAGSGAVVTTAGGTYTIGPIASGSYTVTASKVGFETASQAGVTVGENQALTGVDFALLRGTATISGRVQLCGAMDWSGVLVNAPGGGSATTDPDGYFTIASVASGSYDVTASKAGFQTVIQPGISISVGQNRIGVDFLLDIQQNVAITGAPAVAIPDNNPAGVMTTLNVTDTFTPASMTVRVQVTHTFVGDVKLQLENPLGTRITLVDRPGFPGSTFGCSDNNMDVTFDSGSAVNLESHCAGSTPWYTGVAAPVQSFAAFDGQPITGNWKLIASDLAGGDLGTVTAWTLNFLRTESCAPVDVDPTLDALPMRFVLHEAQPNPFNPVTALRFDLPQAGHVRLAVYDALGKRVATLVEGAQPAGEHRTVWFGRDDAGHALPSGVYIVKLQSPSSSQTRKVTLVR